MSHGDGRAFISREVRGTERGVLDIAAAHREVAALVLSHDRKAELDALLDRAAKSERAPAAWRIIGTLPQHLIDTLGEVMNKGCVTVRELASALNLDSATACNNRIARLYQMHLVRREATIVPEGGRQYCYSAVV